jgi:hypothetical protein
VGYFVRPKFVDPSDSISWGRLCAARGRIRAIENCVSRLLPSLVQREATMLVALVDGLNLTSRRANTAAAARVQCYRVRPTIR